MVLKRNLGQRVAELREHAKLTQAELAERVGVAAETISRLERGSTIPSLARIEEIAGVLGVGLRDLFAFQQETLRKNVLSVREETRSHRTRKEAAVDRLADALRRMPVEDVELVAELAERVRKR